MTRTTPLLLGAIADDLTGGTELASMFVARGVRTGFTVGATAAVDPDSAVHVIALKTRVIAADEAVSQTLEAAERLLAAGARQIFFKYCATFDSTPAGNIGPCAEALLERLGGRLALFCPTLCEVGRTVFQGHMFGGTQLLSESPKRFDPLTPMTDSNLVRVLAAQSKGKVGLLRHAAVDAGADTITEAVEALGAEGHSLVIADAIYERDLAAIARAAVDLPLMTGNSSVAAHLPPVWREKGLLSADAHVEPLPAIDGPAVVLAGSVAPRTAEQLDRFWENHPVLILDLAKAFAGEDLVAASIAFARTHLPAGKPIAIATTVGHHTVEALQGKFGRSEVAEKAEAILAEIARFVVGELGVRRLIVAGGETAGAVVTALGIDRLTMGSYEGPGVARAVALTPVPIALMLKSGKLGGPDIFAEVLEDMTRQSVIEPALDHWPPAKARGTA